MSSLAVWKSWFNWGQSVWMLAPALAFSSLFLTQCSVWKKTGTGRSPTRSDCFSSMVETRGCSCLVRTSNTNPPNRVPAVSRSSPGSTLLLLWPWPWISWSELFPVSSSSLLWVHKLLCKHSLFTFYWLGYLSPSSTIICCVHNTPALL